MRKFLISHKRKQGTVLLGFDVVSTRNKAEAIEKAKAIWIESWNFAFPHNPNGQDEIENMEFL